MNVHKCGTQHVFYIPPAPTVSSPVTTTIEGVIASSTTIGVIVGVVLGVALLTTIITVGLCVRCIWQHSHRMKYEVHEVQYVAQKDEVKITSSEVNTYSNDGNADGLNDGNSKDEEKGQIISCN